MIEDPETAAIITGLLAAMAAGAIYLVGQLAIAWIIHCKRKPDPYDAAGPIIHPADDPWDDWPELEQFLEQRPGLRERYEREAVEQRKGKIDYTRKQAE